MSIKSFISDYIHEVVTHGRESSIKEDTYGVPQGSVLGLHVLLIKSDITPLGNLI